MCWGGGRDECDWGVDNVQIVIISIDKFTNCTDNDRAIEINERPPGEERPPPRPPAERRKRQ